MAVSILYLSFYNHKTITEQTLKFRVGDPQVKWNTELDLPRVHIYILVHSFGCLYFIKMFAFVVGVACGAQKFLYFTPKMRFSRYF